MLKHITTTVYIYIRTQTSASQGIYIILQELWSACSNQIAASLFTETSSESSRKLFAPPWHCSAAASVSFHTVYLHSLPCLLRALGIQPLSREIYSFWHLLTLIIFRVSIWWNNFELVILANTRSVLETSFNVCHSYQEIDY